MKSQDKDDQVQKNEGRAVVLKVKNKKIVNFDEFKNGQDDELKCMRFEKRVLDFSLKNKFKREMKKSEELQNRFSNNHGNGPVSNPRMMDPEEIKNKAPDMEEEIEQDGETDLNEKPVEVDKEKIQSGTDLNDCVICFSRKADAVCMPCGHGGACQPCVMKIIMKSGCCFICKKSIEVVLRIDPSKTVGNMVLVISSFQIE